MAPRSDMMEGGTIHSKLSQTPATGYHEFKNHRVLGLKAKIILGLIRCHHQGDHSTVT